MSYSNSFLEQIKERVPLSSIVSKYVVWDNKKSNQAKRDFWAPCPFHSEKTASFHVDDNKAFYYCFGCHTKGNIFNFLKEKEGLSFQEAVNFLSKKAGLEYQLESSKNPKNIMLKRKLSLQKELVKLHQIASEFYNKNLFTTKGAIAINYLIERGISKATIEEFKIGYAPKEGNALTKLLLEKGFSRDSIEKTGLCLSSEKNVLFDRFRDRVMFPIFNKYSEVVAFGGRTIHEGSGAKYLNSPETDVFKKGSIVFNLNNVKKHLREDDLIIVEGYMDVISLYNSSIKTSVAPLGTALTEKQLSLIWETCEEPVLFFDGDKAGLAATERVVELALPFLSHNKTLRIARPLENFDPDDMLRSEGRDSVLEMLRSSISILDFIVDREKATKPIDSPERIRKLELNLKRKAHSIKDAGVRRLFISKIGEKIDQYNYFPKFRRNIKSNSEKHFYSSFKAKKSNIFKESERELEKIEAGIIYCLINNPTLFAEHRVKLIELDFQDPILKKLFWEMTDKLEEPITIGLKEKALRKALQKDPLLKSHLIYNNEKETEKSKKLLLNAISVHNLALNRLERLKDLKIKLKSDEIESKNEGESLEEAQIKYHSAISGEKYIKESIAKEKEAYKETLDQLSNKVRRKTSEK